MSETLPATVEIVTEPAIATKDGKAAVTYLMELLDKKPKKVVINGKRHIEFDDWIILGNFYGIDVRTGEAEPVEVFGVKGAKAKAEVIRVEDGTVIGGAEAYCMGDERNWKGKPFFQLASMAQTRAGSKALANVLRGFVALKGISGTPAEEMARANAPKPAPASTPNSKKKPSKGKKPAKPSIPKGIDPDKTVDAEVTKKDEPEVHDMTLQDKVDIKALKGVNKEFDKWLRLAEDVGATKKEVLVQCQDMLGKDMEMEEFREIKKRMGMDVK